MKKDEMEVQIKKKIQLFEANVAEMISTAHDVRMMVNEYVHTLVGSFEDDITPTPKPVHPMVEAQQQLISATKKATSKKQFVVKCSECGVETTVPFEPKYNSPVYCSACYKKRNGVR